MLSIIILISLMITNETDLLKQIFNDLPKNNPQEIHLRLDKFMSANPNNAAAHSIRALVYLGENKFKMAEAEADKSIEINPGEHKAWHAKGLIYYIFYHDSLNAATCFKKSLDYRPDNSGSNYFLAQVYANEGLVDDAIKYISKAIENEDNPQYCEYLIILNLLQNNPEEAKKNIQTLIAKHPQWSVRADYFRAHILKMTKRKKEAESYFLLSYDRNVFKEESAENLAELYFVNEDMASAKKWIEISYQCNPLSIKTVGIYSKILCESKEFEKAYAIVDKAIAATPNEIMLFRIRGDIHYQAGRLEESKKDYEWEASQREKQVNDLMKKRTKLSRL